MDVAPQVLCYTAGMDYLFSDEDKDLAQLKWHKHTAGYATRWFGRKKRFAHRLVLERKLGRNLETTDITDHINRDKTDNRRENLRLADKSINTINRDKRPDNTTGYVGVYLVWNKEAQAKGWEKRWTFRVYRKGQKTFCGKHYKSPEAAHKARGEHLDRLLAPI